MRPELSQRKLLKTIVFLDQAAELPTALQIFTATPLDHLIFVGQLLPSRDAALLKIMSEVSERKGKMPQYGKQRHPGLGKRCVKNVDQLLAGCALDDTCQHCMEWRPFKQEGQWRCVTYTPHTCNAVNVIKKGASSTAYTLEQLAPIAAKKLVDNMYAYTLKQLKTDLHKYCRMKPADSIVQKVMCKAKAQLRGDPGGELAKLPVLAEMLRQQGHACQLVTLTSVEMEKVFVDVEHKEFLYVEQKSKLVSERERWDRSMVGKYPVEGGATYCLGWTFPPSTSRKQLDTLIPVS
ncbi:hypothetical protein CYMTET_11056 [Cymbomonas tetramitiformis]|uniref:Uncharacterized protein n=1 Tax=Cymbomonas tetramitiformis TaxID=36881 RepID=A0AAE0LDU4_9CHLO|nr:hypothetical protein CYMTET_11056 [Cymbomonas tetramitiformis]